MKLWSAPLLVSTDICDLSEEKKSILMNEEVLAIHSDPLFIAGERIASTFIGGQVWSRPLENGDMAIVLYNSANHTATHIQISWEEIGWPKETRVKVRDLWNRIDVGNFKYGYESEIAANDVQMLRLSKQ